MNARVSVEWLYGKRIKVVCVLPMTKPRRKIVKKELTGAA